MGPNFRFDMLRKGAIEVVCWIAWKVLADEKSR